MDSGNMAALVRQAQQGSQEAFNELYRLTRDRAYFVAYSIAKNEQDALDILQDAYLKAWQKLDTLHDPALFSAWFRQITGNTAKNFVKKQQPLLFCGGDESPLDWQPEQDDDYIPDAAMDVAETRRLIMGIVGDLPEDQRLLILMYYYDDVKLPEIAAALNLPMTTVSNRLYRARKRISDGVENLEKKQGVKLYGAAPIPLLVWLLKHLAAESSKKLPYAILGGSTAATGGVLAASLLMPKIVAGIAAAVIVAGGVASAARKPARPPDETRPTALAAPDAEADTTARFGFSLPGMPRPGESTAYTEGTPRRTAAPYITASTATAPAKAAAPAARASEPGTAKSVPTTPMPKTPVPAAPETTTTVVCGPGLRDTFEEITTATEPTTPVPPPTTPPAPVTDFEYSIENGGVTITKYVGAQVAAVVVPETIEGKPVVKIGERAFYYTLKMGATVTLPESLREIGAYGFAACGPKQIILPSKLEVIGEFAFNWCDQLESITVPASVKTLGNRAFYNCRSMKSATILAQIDVLEEAVFADCRKMEKVILPDSIKSIGGGCFLRNYPLASINMPAALETIDQEAFMYCCSLPDIVLPPKLRSIGTYAFCCNENMKRIYLPPSLSSISAKFIYQNKDLVFYCEEGSYAHQWVQNASFTYIEEADRNKSNEPHTARVAFALGKF